MRKTTMVFSNIILVLVVVSVSCTAADGALSWGTFLGADWKLGEENLRNDLAVFIKNTQRICTKDVEKICTKGKYVTPQTTAYTNWSGTFKRHMYKHWRKVPIGFGSASDECLNDEFVQYQTGVSKRLIPKCVEWMEKTKGQFDKICKREKGNDKREAFVIFSTIFATAVSGVVGYMFGIFLKERDDLFSYHNRDENKKILIFFCVAISLPLGVIMWASPKLLMVMVGAFGIGRGAQFYVQKKQGSEYLSVPGSDSGLVFAAIPVQMS
mmetsp:Transcript_8885/g.16061  ORF Transcript_8885/g.16061 Transcript_8885/m.16061 type:complete len:268 (+) Transcript_8885:132-935(+)